MSSKSILIIFSYTVSNLVHFSRPYVALMIQCCVCLSVCLSVVRTEYIVAKRCVLQQKLLLTAYVYEKSIGTKMNDLDLCLEVVSRLCQPLPYIRRWISRKPLDI